MKIIFKNAADSKDIYSLKNLKADLFIINFHTTMCFNMVAGIPSAVKVSRNINLTTGADVILHGRLDIEGDRFLSTIVLKDGEIACVSDCITHNSYVKGNALRIVDLHGVKCGIAVDRDILTAGVDNLFCGGARLIIHNSLNSLDKAYYGAYKHHIKLTDGVYVGLFSDGALLGDGKLRPLPNEYILSVPDRAYRDDKTFLKVSKET